MKQKLSYIYVICAALLWGCMGILVRTMNGGGLSSAEVVTVRAVITSIIMVMGMFLFNRKELKIRGKDIWCFLGTGILSVVFFNICYFTCMNYCSLSIAAILLYTAPAFVMVMSFFLFKEAFTWKKILALLCAFGGCVLVSGGFGGSSIGLMGLLTGLGAGFGYALYSIFGRYALQRGYSSFTITTYTFLFAAAGCIPLTGVSHIAECFLAKPGLIWQAVLWTFLTTVAAYLLYTKGLAGMEAGKASVLATIEPVMASVVGAVLFKEDFTQAALLGIGFVLVSSILMMKE
ncbi:MAG: EamA family transporter [Lachnospiraceae bacterium]|nr:EamA family transporter [Lachnospiraceae bacterium]